MRAARLMPACKSGMSRYLAIKKFKSYSFVHFFLLYIARKHLRQLQALTWKGMMTSRGRGWEAPNKMAQPSRLAGTGKCPERLSSPALCRQR